MPRRKKIEPSIRTAGDIDAGLKAVQAEYKALVARLTAEEQRVCNLFCKLQQERYTAEQKLKAVTEALKEDAFDALV